MKLKSKLTCHEVEIEKRPHPPTQTFGTIPQEERRLDVHRKAQRLPRESGKELCLPVSSLPLLEHLHCTNQSRHRDGLGTSASDLCPKRNKRQQNKLRNRYTAVLDRACLFLVHLFLWSVLPTVVSITLPVRGGQFEFIFINTRRNFLGLLCPNLTLWAPVYSHETLSFRPCLECLEPVLCLPFELYVLRC